MQTRGLEVDKWLIVGIVLFLLLGTASLLMTEAKRAYAANQISETEFLNAENFYLYHRGQLYTLHYLDGHTATLQA